jgi:hypothetical protein
MRAQGLRPRGVQAGLAMATRPVWPSASYHSVGTPFFMYFAAQWLARMCPCQRFDCDLTGAAA